MAQPTREAQKGDRVELALVVVSFSLFILVAVSVWERGLTISGVTLDFVAAHPGIASGMSASLIVAFMAGRSSGSRKR